MQKIELNACKQDIYPFLHIRLPTNPRLRGAGGIPLSPTDSPGGVSAGQLQRKPGESPEEHIARITALLDAAAEAMAIAAMEHRRRLEEQKRRAKMKL